jgi:hypothetical protein
MVDPKNPKNPFKKSPPWVISKPFYLYNFK